MMPKPPPKTFHPLAMADSLRAQNQAIGDLIIMVETALDIDGDKMSDAVRNRLREAKDKCRAAWWPE